MESNNDISVLISISRSILSELELLTSSIKASALVRFQNEFLITDLQRKIYSEIDGEKRLFTVKYTHSKSGLN